MRGGPFEDIWKICEKKSHQAEKKLHKAFLLWAELEPTSFCLADIKNYPN